MGEAGYLCVRYTAKAPNLSFRVRCFRAVQEATRRHPEAANVKTWIAIGHSMGARVSSAVAFLSDCHIDACIFLSYPLHPPKQEETLRDLPLTDLTQPLLFVRGTRDSMSSPAPFEQVVGRLAASRVLVHTVEGGDHALKVSKTFADNAEALEVVNTALLDFVMSIVARSPDLNHTTKLVGAGREVTASEGNKQMRQKCSASPKRRVKRKCA
ncbi:hypothetical protein CYMTET_22830 [Cymbomonas tetramitiformis]|uniref:KANL3/Tex30 alpha/beta hydrolase-like domain-containing protein n=1 Tax=Cymbomonas tetramitiformis TaxID=36881 RepID=A0AAE0FZ57_9CHLO|nr:hypothetical protein CYMTET_22830 [Cymbomonas tetramitiformis]